MRHYGFVLLMMGFICLDLPAQSLPEVARHERERREESRQGRVFTNENVRTLRSRTRTQVHPPEAPPTPVDPEANPESGQGSVERTEAEWRNLFAEAREEVTRSEERFALAQQELVDLNQRLLTESSLYNRESILLPEIQAKRGEVAEAELEIERANQAVADLQQELRRAGSPPGWGRP